MLARQLQGKANLFEMSKILIVEDEENLANLLVSGLQSQLYAVDRVGSAEDALVLLATYTYDLLILDWELPGMSGYELCGKFRNQGGTSPVLFLTGKDDLGSKVSGLEQGADDYLCKPFQFVELYARVRSLLRRPATFVSTAITIKGLTLDSDAHMVEAAGKQIILTPREFALLEFLMKHPNHIWSSKALLDSVWPLESALSEDTVRSCMRTLRKKITVEGQECIISTVSGFGYVIETRAENVKS